MGAKKPVVECDHDRKEEQTKDLVPCQKPSTAESRLGLGDTGVGERS